MTASVLYGDKLAVNVTRDFKQLVNISIAAGKFILLHPDYDLIREAVRLHIFMEEMLDDFEIHNSQYETGEIISFDSEEVLFFYALLDLSCRIFLCDAGDDLKSAAIKNGETTETEFYRVRSFHLQKAEAMLQLIRDRFSRYAPFNELQHRMEQLNCMAV
ncbi:MAG: hypothetical protein NT126_08935 [Bacteroidetes bacterium]|nr:hypothetical protein [Bacteroidota bacterium]